jgi:Rhodopirellula transposase DDE domain
MGTSILTEEQLREKYRSLLPHLNERAKRLMLAADAKAIGYGGMSLVHRASGVSRVTITKGLAELDGSPRPSERIRLAGGGRKKITQRYPTISAELERLVEPVSRGDPQSLLRWTTASKQQLAEALQQRGYEIGATTVGYVLREALGYSLQSNKKRYEGKQHADRDQQFAHINKQAAEAIAHGNPVLSVDTKKKELVGNAQKQWERMEAQRKASGSQRL